MQLRSFVHATALSLLAAAAAQAQGLSVTSEDFGETGDGTAVERYTLTNGNEVEVTILTYGGIVQNLIVPDKNGELADISLGFDDLQGYLDNNYYFGALIGRFGNRIAGGAFELEGETYSLPQNNGPNTLHGGPEGFDKRVWGGSPVMADDYVGVDLTYFSADGEMGFPGNLAVTVRYTLNNDNELRIDYAAVTDAPTVVNLTNHLYFNMAGAGSGEVTDQIAMINADGFTPVDDTLIPTGEIRDVTDTPFDLTVPTAIGEYFGQDNEQLTYAEPDQGGYDHNFVLNTEGELGNLAARVSDPQSGRVVEMYTTEPGVQFYTGNFLDGVEGQGGAYDHWGAFTLEAQHFPDAPNQPDFPSTVLQPGEQYSQTTIYKFLPL